MNPRNAHGDFYLLNLYEGEEGFAPMSSHRFVLSGLRVMVQGFGFVCTVEVFLGQGLDQGSVRVYYNGHYRGSMFRPSGLRSVEFGGV